MGRGEAAGRGEQGAGSRAACAHQAVEVVEVVGHRARSTSPSPSPRLSFLRVAVRGAGGAGDPPSARRRHFSRAPARSPTARPPSCWSREGHLCAAQHAAPDGHRAPRWRGQRAGEHPRGLHPHGHRRGGVGGRGGPGWARAVGVVGGDGPADDRGRRAGPAARRARGTRPPRPLRPFCSAEGWRRTARPTALAR
eukprot:COSAG04_NODE_3223_length_3031_cov_2.873806_2_plen_195_part_00